MKEEIKSHWHKWVFYLTLGISFIIIYKLFDSLVFLSLSLKNLLKIVTPFLVGLLMAYLLYIPESKIERVLKKSKPKFIRKNCRKFGILFTYLITIVTIIIIINFILPVLMASINELIGNLQNYYTSIIDMYYNLPDNSVLKTEQVYNALKELQKFDLNQYVSIEQITGYIKGAVGIARGIFDIFVAIIVSIYILSERDEILAFFKRLTKAIFKEKTNENIEKYFYRGNGVFFKFISSQFIDAIVIGILTTIAMQIMHIKYAPLLGFTIGLFNMIPYFGAIVAIAIAGLITFITAGFSKTVIMLIVVIILQQIDANIINPKIIGDSLKMSPILVILAVTIGGAYFGVVGMFLGVPIAGVLKILVNDYIDNRLSK